MFGKSGGEMCNWGCFCVVIHYKETKWMKFCLQNCGLLVARETERKRRWTLVYRQNAVGSSCMAPSGGDSLWPWTYFILFCCTNFFNPFFKTVYTIRTTDVHIDSTALTQNDHIFKICELFLTQSQLSLCVHMFKYQMVEFTIKTKQNFCKLNCNLLHSAIYT